MRSQYIILFLVGILGIISCRSRIQYVPVESNTDSIYIDRLIPYPLPADSASIRALMECDENGKVVLRWLDMANTRNVQLMFTIDSLGNVISNMVVPRDTIYLPSKEIYVDRKIQVPYPVERELSRWEQFKMDVGGWAIGALSCLIILGIGYIIFWLIRRRK